MAIYKFIIVMKIMAAYCLKVEMNNLLTFPFGIKPFAIATEIMIIIDTHK